MRGTDRFSLEFNSGDATAYTIHGCLESQGRVSEIIELALRAAVIDTPQIRSAGQSYRPDPSA